MEEKKEEKLYIPLNVRKRKEVFSGFGRTEIGITGIGLGVGIIIGILFYLLNDQIYCLIGIPIIISMVTAVCIIKDQTNTSLVDSIKEFFRFSKSQKRYYYSYNNIYERILNEEK